MQHAANGHKISWVTRWAHTSPDVTRRPGQPPDVLDTHTHTRTQHNELGLAQTFIMLISNKATLRKMAAAHFGCNLLLSTVTDNQKGLPVGLANCLPACPACLTCRWHRCAHNLLTFTSNLPWQGRLPSLPALRGTLKLRLRSSQFWPGLMQAICITTLAQREWQRERLHTAELRKFEAINVRYSTVNAIGQLLCYGTRGA